MIGFVVLRNFSFYSRCLISDNAIQEIICNIASEIIDTFFDDSRTTRAEADGKDSVPADISGSQTKMLCAG